MPVSTYTTQSCNVFLQLCCAMKAAKTSRDFLMKFSTSLRERDLPIIANGIIRIVGWEKWKKRFDWLQFEIQSSPMMQFYIEDWFAMEMAFHESQKKFRLSGKYPKPSSNSHLHSFFSFASTYLQAHSGSSELLSNLVFGHFHQAAT
jgi:hypothetical protein